MTEPTTCCHTHEVMDVAAAIVTPGEDVDALKAELEQAGGLLRYWVELYGDKNSAITGNTKHFLEEKP